MVQGLMNLFKLLFLAAIGAPKRWLFICTYKSVSTARCFTRP